MLECSVQLASLEASVARAFERYRDAGARGAMLMTVEGTGRVPRELVDLLVEALPQTQREAFTLALVRNDVIINFLASSLILRGGLHRVRAFKERDAALAWLAQVEA